MRNLIDLLRTDFGRKTLGELIQERESAAREIERLTAELDALRERLAGRSAGPRKSEPAVKLTSSQET